MKNIRSFLKPKPFQKHISLLSVCCFLFTYIAVLALNSAEQTGIFNWYWKLAILFFSTVLFLIATIRSASFERLSKENLQKGETIQAITAKHQAAELALEKAKHSINIRSRFLAQMSHEIRNPLNSILGFSELLSKRKLDTQSKQFVDMIAQSGDGLLQLLNDILDLNKIDDGKLRLEAISFNFKEVVSSTVLPYTYIARQKNLDFELIFDPKIPTKLIADPYRFRQILHNLISNSIKFTKKGKVCVRFSVAGGNDETVYIQTQISDSGIGIPADKLDDIFNPFTQSETSTTREFGGSGLGLTIVAELVKLMEGEISISSPNPFLENNTETPGTLVSIELPLPLDPDNTLPEIVNPLSEIQFEYTLPKPVRILVAEDNVVNQVLFQTLLENMGASVDIVSNGQEAINALKKGEPYNMVFMDIQMPVINGLAASRTIRRDLGISIPIVGATASAFEEDIRLAQQAGMNDYLPKPFKQKELYEKVCHWGIQKPKISPIKTRNNLFIFHD